MSEPVPQATPKRRGKAARNLGIGCGVLILAVIILGIIGSHLPPTATSSTAPVAASPAVVAPSPAAPAANSEPPVDLEGEGTKNTAPFHLSGGAYRADWTATDRNGSVGCFHAAELKSDSYSESIGSHTVAAGQKFTDSTFLYRVPAGNFYVSTTSGCAWTVSIRRQ